MTKVVVDMNKVAFTTRLVELRKHKGVSARDMSLSLGQSTGYINNIEKGINYPSMAMFFTICEYLDITPKDFFDTEMAEPAKSRELLSAVSGLQNEQMDHLIAIAKCFK